MDTVGPEGGERDRAPVTPHPGGRAAAGRQREQPGEARLLEARQLEARAAPDEAQHISQSRSEFLATFSHELRTPLSAILGWAHVLELGVCDAQTVQHGLAAISRQARRQGQLIEDLLDLNRIESGQLCLALQRVQLGVVVAAAVDAALPAATAKGVGLRTVFSPCSGLVLGDAARLQQVLDKLLGNAIRFTPAGGQVSVRLSQEDGRVRVTVADSGKGIEAQLLPRLFDCLQQPDATTTGRQGGPGIGLALVRQLVQLQGGTVRADSPGAGLGATFTVCFPATDTWPVPGPAVPTEALASPHPVRQLAGVSVLLVDDEPDVRAATAASLQDAGAHVRVAVGAVEALLMLSERLPDVIVSNLAMPCVDGHEWIRQVRCLPDCKGGCTPAAAYSALSRPEDTRQALAAGYQRHWIGPLAPAALVQAVLDLLRSA